MRWLLPDFEVLSVQCMHSLTTVAHTTSNPLKQLKGYSYLCKRGVAICTGKRVPPFRSRSRSGQQGPKRNVPMTLVARVSNLSDLPGWPPLPVCGIFQPRSLFCLRCSIPRSPSTLTCKSPVPNLLYARVLSHPRRPHPPPTSWQGVRRLLQPPPTECAPPCRPKGGSLC